MGGLYFFLPITGYDNGDFTSYKSPPGFRNNNLSPLYAHNVNPIAISYIAAVVSFLLVSLALKVFTSEEKT